MSGARPVHDESDELDVEETRTAAVLEDLERMKSVACSRCAAVPCGHEALMSLVMGFKNGPMCFGCLASVMERDRGQLRDHLLAYILHHHCYRSGWEWAGREEGFTSGPRPPCLWPAEAAWGGDGVEQRGSALEANEAGGGGAATGTPGPRPRTDGSWDAGDMSCGDLVLELRIRLRAMRAGEVLLVTATDPGAPEDLPAWCRLTGHPMVAAEHPLYWIRRKEG